MTALRGLDYRKMCQCLYLGLQSQLFDEAISIDKQFFLAMKKLKTTKRNISWTIKDKNGNILTSKDEILERWALFYEELDALH